MRYEILLEAIAALQTRPDLREGLLKHPHETLSQLAGPPLALEADECASLASISAHDLRVLDAMSRFHRWTRLQEHLPWLDPGLRPELSPLLQAYLTLRTPSLLNRADAVDFCLFVEEFSAHRDAAELLPTPLAPFLVALCGLERRSIQLAWGLECAKTSETFTAAYPLLTLRDWLRDHPQGWPELAIAPVQITLTKVPWVPGVRAEEQRL